MQNIKNAYNVHTGLLPSWGGVDILYHTVKNRNESYIFEQGITFHKMTEKLDYGPIISKLSYPIIDNDTIITLYDRITQCFPSFVLSSLKLLETFGIKQVSECYKEKPRIFKRNNIDEGDTELYRNTLKILKDKYEYKKI